MAYTTINKSTDYFNTVPWTGTSSSPLNVTGFGFQPDWVWNKYRAGAGDHQVYDIVRGATKMIIPNSTNAESTNANGVTALITDGFTAGSDINVNGGNSVAWGWKAANSQGSSNTDGSINTTYTSVNTTAGFSISQYTGAGSTSTVGHGLGVAPKVIIIKCTSNGSTPWEFYHESIGNNKKLNLNSTAAEASSGYMNNTSPTSSVFTVTNDADIGGSGRTYIAYSFAEKTGYSKFGSYTGNGNANGPFVYTGFKPAWIMMKDINSGSAGWMMFDNKRLGYNVDNNALFPNANAAEGTGDDIDLLSNGFKARSTDAGINTSSNIYIFMAFAAEPLVGSNNIPCTAR